MRFILICLAAVLLSGCGYIAGKRVDFGSDFNNSNNPKIQELAGKTFYISNDDDYERLIQLKRELRELSNSQTPTRFLQASCERYILQITDQYDSGILGFIFTGKIKSPFGDDKKSSESEAPKVVETKKELPRYSTSSSSSNTQRWWQPALWKALFMALVFSFIAYARNRWPESEVLNPPEHTTPEQPTRWKALGMIFIAGLIIVILIIFFSRMGHGW